MSTPEQEGREAFVQKQPKDFCPYEGGRERIEWHLGYAKQEYEELQREQSSLLDSMGYYSSPYTGLEDIIRDVKESVQQYQNALSR